MLSIGTINSNHFFWRKGVSFEFQEVILFSGKLFGGLVFLVGPKAFPCIFVDLPPHPVRGFSYKEGEDFAGDKKGSFFGSGP